MIETLLFRLRIGTYKELEEINVGNVFFWSLILLLTATIVCFVLDFHSYGYIFGTAFGACALGVGFVYTSKDDDDFRPNNLN
jgi:cadmium resistance protein CadD (predicted permease)